jgi:hypothetical protein
MTAANGNPEALEVLAEEVRAVEEEYGLPEGVDLIHLRWAINAVEVHASELGVDLAAWLDERADGPAEPPESIIR